MVALLAFGCQPSDEARVAHARALHEAGRFEASIAPLRELLDAQPDHAEGNYLLGVALVQTGEPNLAAWRLAKAAAEPEFAVGAGLLLASSLLATRNPDEAIAAAERVLAADPEQWQALELRARARLQRGHAEEALADVERVLAARPERLESAELRLQALMALERFDEAEAELLRASEHVAQAEPALAARFCLSRVALRREQDEVERAEERLRECLAASPTDAATVRYAVGFFDATGQPERATEILRQAMESAPEALALRSSLAERLRGLGQGEAAERLLVEATELYPSAQAWSELADFQRRARNAAAARQALEHALELAGEDAPEPLRFSYADVLADLGELDRAEAIAGELRLPVYAELIRGRVLLARGEARAALGAFEAGLRLWPNNPGARFFAGQAAEALGDIPRALSEYREAVRADPRATDAALALAQLHHALGDHQAALAFALRHARTHPNSVEGYVVGAHAATALGNYEAARRALAGLARIEGTERTVLIERAAVERAAGGAAAGARVIEESDLDLSEAGNEAALRSLVEDLLVQERFDAALARIDEALARRPEAAGLHDARGRALQRAGRSGEAARLAFERALELDPDYAPALAGLASVSWEEGAARRAIELFDRAAQADPGQPEHAYAAAQLVAARGGEAEAEARLRALIERHPYHAGACNDLAWRLAERGEDLELALALAERASELQPEARTLDTLGWVHFRRGEFEPAAQALARAAEEAPDVPAIRYRLGRALAAGGDAEGALRAFRAALETGPFPQSDAARAEITRLETGTAGVP